MKLQISSLVCALAMCFGNQAFAGPITDADTIVVDDLEWAQVDLFTDLTWNEVNAVCPLGVCGTGTLNGFDMSGWRWASVDDVNALFNVYLSEAGLSGTELLGPGPDETAEPGAAAIRPFFESGWRPITGLPAAGNIVSGLTATESADDPSEAYAAMITTGLFSTISSARANASTDTSIPKSENLITEFTGSWFYRDAVSAVPQPGSLVLTALALLALSARNRKQGH